jgi:hypothetical protein
VSSNPGLEILIQSILDSKGFDELKNRLEEAKDAAQSALKPDPAAAFKDALLEVGVAVVGIGTAMEALKEGIEFVKEALKAAIEGERLIDQMAAANEVFAKSSGVSKAASEEWARALETSAGVARDQFIPAYTRLVAVTGDVETAQRLTTVAALAQKAGLGEASEAAAAMIRYMETGNTSARGFGAVIKSLAGDTKDTSAGLAALEKAVTDMAGKVNDASTRTDQLTQRWKQAKEALGEFFTWLVDLKEIALKGASYAIAGFTALIIGLQAPFRAVLAAAKPLFGAVVEFIEGNYKKAWASLKESGSAIAETFETANMKGRELFRQLDKSWEDHAKKVVDVNQKLKVPIIKTKDDILKETEEAMRKELTVAEITAHGEEELIQNKIAVYKKYLALFPLGSQQQLDVVKAMKSATEQEEKILQADEAYRVAREKRIHDLETKDDADRVRQFNKDHKTYITTEEAALKERFKSELEYKRNVAKLYDDMAAEFIDDEQMKTEYHKKAVEARVAADQQEAKLQEEVASGVMGLASEMFGKSKAMSIAQAVINTYEGATKALSQGGIYGAVLAAIVIATGLAQVAKIESTDPTSGGSGGKSGGGFDDPRNDFAAYLGGQRWAKDMVDHFSAGAAAGFHHQVTTNDNRKTFNQQQFKTSHTANYSIRDVGLLDPSSDVMMRKLVRRLQVVGVQEGQRTPK